MYQVPSGFVNVAAIIPFTRSLGPGNRAAVWAQGCLLHCPGCLAPDWLPRRPARLMRIEELSEELLTNPEVSGLTFSGGEPMLQAQALARVAELARRQRSLSLITFTGFRYERLLASDPEQGYQELLAQTDVLVDGPYIQERNDGTGLRGSNNQRIIHLTSRLRSEDLEITPRSVEIHISNGEVQIVGIPTLAIQGSLDQAFSLPSYMEAMNERL